MSVKKIVSPKVSIIIPVFNAEKFLERCLDSALSQTHQNCEIICINDGSTDSSLKILRRYEKKFPSIKVFSHKNHGLGFTRNIGMKNSSGDFITFLDSDDWLEPSYVETLLKKIGDNDVVISGFKRYNFQYIFQYQKEPERESFSKYKYCSIAGKMFRMSFIAKNNLKFQLVKMGEDGFFNISAYAKTKKITVVPYAGYCNYENVKSMTMDVKYDEDKTFYSLLKSIVAEVDIKKLDQDDFLFYVIKTLLVDILLYQNCLTSAELTRHYRKSIYWYKELLKDYGQKLHLRFNKVKGEDLKIVVFVNMFIFSFKTHTDWILIRLIKKAKISII